MHRSVSIVCAVLLGVGAQAHGEGLGLKPGLWEVKIVKSVVDGVDNTAQIAAMADALRQKMAALAPEQRAQLEARLKQSGLSRAEDGGLELCVSPEMARRDQPIVYQDGRCQPTAIVRNGKQTSYEFNCSSNGITTTGKGLATVNGGVIMTHVDMTVQPGNGQARAMTHDARMSFISPDCGEVQPARVTPPGADSPAAAPPPATPPAATPRPGNSE